MGAAAWSSQVGMLEVLRAAEWAVAALPIVVALPCAEGQQILGAAPRRSETSRLYSAGAKGAVYSAPSAKFRRQIQAKAGTLDWSGFCWACVGARPHFPPAPVG